MAADPPSEPLPLPGVDGDRDRNHDGDKVAALERKVAAQAKVIDVLTRRVEERANTPSTAFALFEESASLEGAVRHRVQQSERQRKELEQTVMELKQAQAELMHAQKLTAIGQLAAGVAHEINTPIQYVTDNTTFLQRSFATLLDVVALARPMIEEGIAPDPEALVELRARLKRARLPYLEKQVPRAIEQSLEGLNRVATIVRAMKVFSHDSRGEKAEVNLRESIESTVTIARNEWKYVADVELLIDDDFPPVVCLRDELNQVILNLVINAAHAIADVVGDGTDVRGLITISAVSEGDWVELRIRDTGAGIPESIRARVFDPFFTTKAVGKGTGQGLAIAYSVVVEKHKGSIAFESELGRGTTFVIRIPRDPESADKEAA
jgi:two-component system, NtrC family, sensor kinase